MKQEQDVYKAELALIVGRAFNAASQPKTIEECMSIADDWYEDLEDEVPVDRLPELYKYTKKRHDSVFPISANEMLIRFREMTAEEERARKQAQLDRAAELAIERCPDKHLHNEENCQEYMVGSNYFRWLPCATCRYDAHWARVRQIHQDGLDKPRPDVEAIMLDMMRNAGGLKVVK